VILDIRPDGARAREGIIPGSIYVNPTAIEKLEATVLSAHEIVIYCACPNEASAANIAQRLMSQGAKRVRPLLGGIYAWTDAGFEVHVFSAPSTTTAATV
jgi:rhodanese-related sulfurtransferase